MYDDIVAPTLLDMGTRPPHRTRQRATLAAGVLVLLCAGMLADALLDSGRVSGSPVELLTAAAAALLVGAWCRPAVAFPACLVSAGLLTAANQVVDPHSYTVANDFTFFSVALAGPALVGGAWAVRTGEIRELRRLSRTRTAQRDKELQLARVQEQNRLATQVQRGLVQQLGAIVLQCGGASREDDEATTRQALQAVEGSAREALDDLRAHLGALRDASDTPASAPAAIRAAAPTRPPIDWTDLLAGSWGVAVAVESVTSGASRGPIAGNLALSLALCAPLVWRRRRPLTAVVAVALLAGLMSHWFTPLPATVTSMVPLLLLAHALGSHASGARRVVGLGLLVAGILLVARVSPPDPRGADGLVPTLLWVGLAALAGVASRQGTIRKEKLQVLLRQIEESRAAERRLVAAEQRHSLARDLHDSVAHAMTVVCLHANAAQGASSDRAARQEALTVIRDAARAGLAELRAGLDAVEAAPSAVLQLGQVVAAARRAGLAVRLHESDDCRDLPSAVAELTARVVREALVNVARHASGAQVEVLVSRRDSEVVVEVVDSGSPRSGSRGVAGFAWGTGRGLALLGERVAALEGRLEHTAIRPSGYRVTARLPLPRSVPA